MDLESGRNFATLFERIRARNIAIACFTREMEACQQDAVPGQALEPGFSLCWPPGGGSEGAVGDLGQEVHITFK